MSGTMVFEERDDGFYVLGAWKERIRVAAELIENSLYSALSRDGDVLHIQCANGRASYRIAGEEDGGSTLVGELQYAEHPEMV